MWPSSSPNLNPLDYSIWEHVATKACANAHSNVGALKASMEKQCAAMTSDYIKKCCKRFKSRVVAAVKADGGVFDK